MLRLLSLCLLLGSAAATPPELVPTQVASPKSKSPLCDPCVQLGGQALNILINVILNEGVIGGCTNLCGHLNSTAARDACDLVCGTVGIKAFIKALDNTDLDPIYFCELLHTCKAGADDAHIDLLDIKFNPPKIALEDIQPGMDGVDIEGVLTINVTKETGVGEWGVGVHGPVDGGQGPLGGSFSLPDGLKAGMQTLGVKLHIVDTFPDPSSQDFPITWMPGSYEFRFHVCQGECGSKHPHSIDFGRKSGNFTIGKSSQIVV